MATKFKPLTLDDFKLTPDEMKTLVAGAQRFLPPTDENGDPINPKEESNGNPN